MDFLEAVKAMKQGKKVKRENWCSQFYAKRKGEVPLCFFKLDKEDEVECVDDKRICFEDINATDWEIVEDKKTLSDKIEVRDDCSMKYLYVEDLKSSLKEVQKEANITLSNDNLTISWSKFKKIFGEELIE